MEVDTPGSSTLSQALTDGDKTNSQEDLMMNPLKRSNSAPMINVLGVTTAETPCTSSTSMMIVTSCSRPEEIKPLERIRRFSTSSMALNSTPVKGPSRLVQIRREETMAQKEREEAQERDLQSTLQISQSMEDIFVDESASLHPLHQTISPPMAGPPPPIDYKRPISPSMPIPAPPIDCKRPKSLGEPLHIHVSQYYPYASSPSPTRVGKQCYSPSLQQPVYRTGPLTPSPSPSPTRKSFASPLSRRSLSPITLRPSPLGNPSTKRKMDLDGERMDTFCSPAKRFHSSMSPGGYTPDRSHTTNHHLLHSSISSISCDACSSPDQRVPNVSTSRSASFFRPVRDSTESRGTDSETSDITDVSEAVDVSSHLTESTAGDTSVLSSASTSSLSPLVHHTPLSSASSSPKTTTESSSSLLTTPMATMSVSPVPTVSTMPTTMATTMSAVETSSSNYFNQNKVTQV